VLRGLGLLGGLGLDLVGVGLGLRLGLVLLGLVELVERDALLGDLLVVRVLALGDVGLQLDGAGVELLAEPRVLLLLGLDERLELVPELGLELGLLGLELAGQLGLLGRRRRRQLRAELVLADRLALLCLLEALLVGLRGALALLVGYLLLAVGLRAMRRAGGELGVDLVLLGAAVREEGRPLLVRRRVDLLDGPGVLRERDLRLAGLGRGVVLRGGLGG
jgi:hypothetical protein